MFDSFFKNVFEKKIYSNYLKLLKNPSSISSGHETVSSFCNMFGHKEMQNQTFILIQKLTRSLKIVLLLSVTLI